MISANLSVLEVLPTGLRKAGGFKMSTLTGFEPVFRFSSSVNGLYREKFNKGDTAGHP